MRLIIQLEIAEALRPATGTVVRRILTVIASMPIGVAPCRRAGQ
jgi:hypothetical protein